jgi:hypothetical protein
MMKAQYSQRKNSSEGIELTEEDKLMLMPNNQKMHVPQLLSVSRSIQM